MGTMNVQENVVLLARTVQSKESGVGPWASKH
jgi:hypothetical protein